MFSEIRMSDESVNLSDKSMKRKNKRGSLNFVGEISDFFSEHDYILFMTIFEKEI